MTCSVDNAAALQRARRQVFLALFVALAVVLHTLEALFPSPAPWFRLGLANILTVTALLLYGAGAAWWVTLARILVSSILLGTLFSPAFFLSLAGGVAAVAVMASSSAACGHRLGPVGCSALGAAAHAAGQLAVAWLLLVRHEGLWLLLPFFLLSSVLAGVLNGVAADLLLDLLRGHPAFAAEAPRRWRGER